MLLIVIGVAGIGDVGVGLVVVVYMLGNGANIGAGGVVLVLPRTSKGPF